MSVDNRMSDLITIAEELTTIILAENQALEEDRADVVTANLERKDLLSRAYQRSVEGLRKQSTAEIKSASSDLQERLKMAGKQLEDVSEINAKLLRVAVAANQAVVDAIVEAVKTQTPTAGTYSNQGTTQGLTQAPASVAISYNKTL